MSSLTKWKTLPLPFRRARLVVWRSIPSGSCWQWKTLEVPSWANLGNDLTLKFLVKEWAGSQPGIYMRCRGAHLKPALFFFHKGRGAENYLGPGLLKRLSVWITWGPGLDADFDSVGLWWHLRFKASFKLLSYVNVLGQWTGTTLVAFRIVFRQDRNLLYWPDENSP